MSQTSESLRATSSLPEPTLRLRPLSRALGAAGYRGHLLVLASAALWLPLQAQAQSVGCNGGGPLICTVTADETVTSSLTLRNPYRDSQVTNEANFHVVGTAVSGSGQVTPLSDYEEAIVGGSFVGIQMITQGTDGSDNGDQHHRDGGPGMGAMLTTQGSVVLDLAGVAPTEMVLGVAVSSLGGDGFDQPSDTNNGGNGGSAGSTTLFNNSDVTITGGTLAAGVVGALVQSLGGQGGGQTAEILDYYGGNGGSTQNIEMDHNATLTLGSATSSLRVGTRAWGVAALNVGGDGHYSAKGQTPWGQGGSAANVRLSAQGSVGVFVSATDTVADGVVGVLARSQGGRGGDGQWRDDDAGNGGNASQANLTVGDPGLGEVMTITVGSDQVSSGISAGVLAQSLGGDGGIQQSNAAHGGKGGQADAVTVGLNWVNLSTTGDAVSGVVAQSLGGNGGGDNENSYRDDGGDGGQAGAVTVTLTSKGDQDGEQTTVSTQGEQAFGVVAQSVGGYGGDAVKQGGQGQNAATAQITADANSMVLTAGDDAIGMLVQSIGGGGGMGEDFTSGLVGGSGNGGNGGNGAEATLQSDAQVQTQGQDAHGLVVQSIGGSGGAGSVSGTIVALGGNGGAGGAGSTVNVKGTPQVSTQGDRALGVIAQSIGGGGGVAGSATGLFSVGGSVSDAQDNSAGAVTVAVGAVDTQGDGAIGVLAQSVGGGGGSAGSAMGITAVGGAGESGGAGGTVTVDPGSSITTQGRYAPGLVAQSIGGGGGNGGDTLAITVGNSTSAIGGNAGAASAGGSVTVQNSVAGKISTTGDGATAVLAQSIGGGGGHGGSAQIDTLLSAATVAVGGRAGGGGSGGEVQTTLSNYRLSTQGATASGLVAQSVGGGGGNGGAAHSFDASVGFSLGVTVGGSGGQGGNGGQVGLALDNVSISTAGVGTSGSNGTVADASAAGTDAYGVVAQSIGGGGGNGGSASARSITVAVPDPDASFAISADVAVGGSGGSGGSGGEVDIKLEQGTAVYTGGQGSHGVVVQSIGGGGGNGGASNAMSTDVSLPAQSVSVNVNVAVGGSGGFGGTGGEVNLDLGENSSITTFDDLSNGVLAQSIGGGGGNAGVGSSGAGGVAQGKAYNVLVGVGGKSSSGAVGGDIQASLAPTSTLTTYGSGSRGIVLHSVGGGGGASQGTTVDVGLPISVGGGGGAEAAQDEPASGATKFSASVSVAIGADGGIGGHGGTATLTALGQIHTAGDDADGILLQSIGGGGGLGGNAGADATAGPTTYAVPTAPGEDPPANDPPDNSPPGGGSGDDPSAPEDNDLGSYSLSVAVGGSGGASGNGSDATLNFSGVVKTTGALADAVVVQSIGGGGGVGGVSSAKGAAGSSQANVAVGGQGGAGGHGGDITLNLTGTQSVPEGSISTVGDNSYGLLAQSIGGGGGQGAAASDIITKATVENPSLVLGWGGANGNGGNGGTVNMKAPGSIVSVTTSGADAHGMVLQSIGGGGGTATLNGASLGGTARNPELTVQIGGGGGVGGGSGGDITVDSSVGVVTHGDHAFGLVAQSIGGGGGIATAGPGAGIQALNLVAPAGNYALSGGNVNVTLGMNMASTSGSSISTSGRGAHGIVLQSIAGGGGIAGDTAMGPLALGWSGGAAHSWGGVSGNIDLTLNAAVATTGAGAHGVVAQLLSAPGGLGGDSAGSFAGVLVPAGAAPAGVTGSMTLTLDNTVAVTGQNAWGVFAQTYGRGPANTATPVTLTVSNNVSGGVGAGADGSGSGGAIWIDSTEASQVTITSGGTVNGALGTAAIQSTGSGPVSVINHGVLNGNLLGVAANANATANATADATVASQARVAERLPSAALRLSNTGTFSHAQTVQGHVDNDGLVVVGRAAGADTLHVSGNFTQGTEGRLQVGADFVGQTADALVVDGQANLGGQVQVLASTLVPRREIRIVQAGTLSTGATVQGASNLFSFGSSQVGDTLAVSAESANFQAVSAQAGLGRNLQAVGQHLQDIWDRGGSDSLGALYAQLDHRAAAGAPAYGAALNDLSLGASAAPAALATGAVKGFADRLFSCPVAATDTLLMADGRCVWGQGTGKSVHLDGSGGTSATTARGQSYQFGMQQRMADHWTLGASAAYEHSTIRSADGRVRIKGNAGYLGAVLQYESGPWTLGSATFGSYGSYDGKRRIQVADAVANSDFHVWSVGQQFRAAYLQGTAERYVKPFVTLDVIYTRMPSYQEHGAGAFNLNVHSSTRGTAVLTPGVQVGGRVDLGSGYELRPYASAGVSLSSAGHWSTTAHLAGRPAGSMAFNTRLETGNVYGQVAAGLQLLSRQGLDVQLQYDGVFSGRVRSASGSLKAIWRF